MTDVITVTEDTLAALVAAGSVRAVHIHESGNKKYAVVAKTSTGDQTLCSRRGNVRLWGKLDTLKRYLKDHLGVVTFEVIGQ